MGGKNSYGGCYLFDSDDNGAVMDSKVPHKGDADVNGSILILLLWVALMLALLNLTTTPTTPLCVPGMTQETTSHVE